MWCWIHTAFLIVAVSSSSLTDSEDNVKLVTQRINTTLELPCGPFNDTSIGSISWYTNDYTLEEIPDTRTILPNGDLRIRIREEDSDILYRCVLWLTGTSDMKPGYIYGIAPIEGVFLDKKLENVTLDWGSNYTIACQFAGLGQLNITMVLNKKVVTERTHNITEDSVLECYGENSVGKAHAKSFITIRAGSKEWAKNYGVPNNSYCRPYLFVMSQSSICFDHMTELSKTLSGYLIAQSRLYLANETEAALERLFTAWDDVLIGSSLRENRSSRIAYHAWRCVNRAKLLACALAYPRCEVQAHDHNLPIDETDSNKMYKELVVCRPHCMAVAGLFCLASLHSTEDEANITTSALGPLLSDPPSRIHSPTGWDQLIRVEEAQQSGLPSPFAQSFMEQSSENVQRFCSAIKPTGTDSQGDKAIGCTRLPLDQPEPVPQLESLSQVQPPPVDSSKVTDSCLSGSGVNYHGTDSVAACLPWAALQAQPGAASSSPPAWPSLYALHQSVFPQSLDNEANSLSVCRNPGGLAPRPFCLSPYANSDDANTRMTTDGYSHSTSMEITRFRITLCNHLPLCKDLANGTAGLHPELVPPTELGDLGLSTAHVQVIICSLLAIFILFAILIGYVVWRTKRYGLQVLNWSSLDLSETGLIDDTTVKAREKAGMNQDADFTGDQLRLQHRRRWLRRRRRLRQQNRVCQCIYGWGYLLYDCLTCQTLPQESTEQPQTAVGGSHSTAGQKLDMVDANDPENASSGCPWCPPFDKHTKRTGSFKEQDEATRANRSCSKIRRFTQPLRNGTDRDNYEFEVNALSMQQPRSVAYVANATSVTQTTSSRRPHSLSNDTTADLGGGGGGHGICIDCELLVDQLTCNLCHTCHAKMSEGTALNALGDNTSNLLEVNADMMNEEAELGPSYPLTQSSLHLINSGPTDIGWTIMPDRLLNMPSMVHLLHPNRLVELRRLAKRAFGWILLAQAPNLPDLVRRHRLLSGTAAERLGLSKASESERSDSDNSPADMATTNESTKDPLVVVRMLTDDATLEAQANFLREAEVLIELSHKNIIRLLGLCLPLKPLSLLLEYMPFGDLTTFLRHYTHATNNNTQPVSLSTANGLLISGSTLHGASVGSDAWVPPLKLTTLHLLHMARDACDAMIYLSNKYYVHRDVATRSFLVGNKMSVKLSDFFMCRPVKPGVDLVERTDAYVPVKWLPLESILEGLFQMDTDVWSYGVYLWELFTFADEPYGTMSHEEVICFLEDNERLSQPVDCPAAVYDLMLSCWSSQRSNRPTFTNIRTRLNQFLTDHIVPS